MLGPFYDRSSTTTPIGPERWQKLVSDPDYSDVATDRFPPLGVIVKTRWLGHDRQNNQPPRIFATHARGDSDVAEVTTATEDEALAAHELMCQRYREQMALLEDGGAGLLSAGVL